MLGIEGCFDDLAWEDVSTENGAVMVDNAKVGKTDVLCSNGVIHVIDTVVLPKTS